MTDPIDNQESHIDTQQPTASPNSRRSFLKKGAVVSAPLVLTAFSRPVLALKCTPSGVMSGPGSGNHLDDECFQFHSPGGWRNNYYWPPGTDPGELFSAAFTEAGDPNNEKAYTGNLTLMQALNADANTKNAYGIAKHLTAGVLNAAMFGSDYPYSIYDIKEMFSQAFRDGFEFNGVIRSKLDATWENYN